MPVVNWTNSLSLDIPEMDTQHKKWLDIINQLGDAMSQGKSNEILGNTFNELLAFTKKHFADEERFQQKIGFPDFTAHKAKHTAFIQQIEQYKSDYESGRMGMSIKVMNTLSSWLVEHIKVVDKKYAAHYHEAAPV